MASIPIPRQTAVSSGFPWHIVGYCERVGAAILLAAFSPLLCFSLVTVALLSGRTPLIAHRRVGWRGNTLWMLKLRTMWDSPAPRSRCWIEYIDDQTGPKQKQEMDPRVRSRFARFCRTHSIDELPQLLHVLRGEMSLVGPRPLTESELGVHYGSAAREVLEVKPGLAGLWQISGRNRLDYSDRRRLDLAFVRNRSLRMYVAILLRTIPEVWNGSNAW
ncbi:MAG TPA: sugar transferase [Bryobacteraceae bacterium]|nr:sugar transferase [Bryobacteraceae bacterium]